MKKILLILFLLFSLIFGYQRYKYRVCTKLKNELYHSRQHRLYMYMDRCHEKEKDQNACNYKANESKESLKEEDNALLQLKGCPIEP